MDFWSRLIGSASKQKQHSASAAHSPQQRLQRFRRAYNPILQLCSRPNITAANGPALDQLRVSLQRLAAILREEGRTPAPHLCLSFAASAQIYSVIARAASTSQNEAVIREATAVFSILVDCEEEDFLASTLFAKSLIRFIVRVTSSASIGHDTETDLMEVLFGVAAKLRSQPEILPAWFRATSRQYMDSSLDKEKKSFAGATQKDDFPMCYLLIDRIHLEGRAGDFARTGLLYIFEAVGYSPELEDWIIGSDLPTLMASGLGALYSQLSRELSIRHEPEHLPLMLAMSDYVHSQPVSSAENIFSTTHANHVSTFLSHLAFWQDVLEHCKSPDVKQTLLDHFQILFLQQLLYPSLLQSSDTDGGSSVAVLTYVANTLEALDHPDLVHMILQYLLAMPESRLSMPPRSPKTSRRQSSLMLLSSASNNEEEKVDPNLFSLVDLILNGIRSRNSQTAVAALKLSSVLLNRHTDYAVSTLIKAELPSNNPEQRTAGALSAESEALIKIAASFSYDESLDDAYTTALQDIVPPLEVQLVQQLHGRPDSMSVHPAALHSTIKLGPNDPFLSAVSTLFQSFFTNSVDVNLSLTEAVMQLALRAHISLEGWLAIPPSSYKSIAEIGQTASPVDLDHADEEERLAFQRLRAAHLPPAQEDEQKAMLPSLLSRLQTQIDHIRGSITNIDALIAKRIEILSGVEKHGSTARPESRTPSRLSSDVGSDRIGSQKPAGPRQVQRLKSGSVASSRLSSPIRSSTPSKARDHTNSPSRGGDALTRDQSDLVAGRLSHGVFKPPPPDSGDEGVVPDDPAVESSISSPTPHHEHEAETLRRKLFFQRPNDSPNDVFSFVAECSESEATGDGYDRREASTSHVITNVVILHFFLLELVAVLQTRAVMFEEVVFS